MPTEREQVAVVLGPDNTVVLPLVDAVAEYFRISALSRRTVEEERILAALTQTMGTLITTAEGPNQALRDALK